ncbi:hypothetical protein GXP70_22140 [Paenibacillus lycopersici]|uniref:Lipoprotein n=1 Tax=Paenibacillus lycopersici TaxID=2704462 RepID=A0A6C0G701_9BACL|nr:hypothetical protein [Paenibacillus lycopersici]QHT62415.1 hypothetical protein GXP70_22140 [Paenibacillus lycopersici]
MRYTALFGTFLLAALTFGTACSDEASKTLPAQGNLHPEAVSYNEPPNSSAYDHVLVQIDATDNAAAASSRTIEDADTVAALMNALSKIDWENAKVSMSRPPDFKLSTRNTDPLASFEPQLYETWISPQRDQLEFVQGSQGRYGRLSAADSAKLIAILLAD